MAYIQLYIPLHESKIFMQKINCDRRDINLLYINPVNPILTVSL